MTFADNFTPNDENELEEDTSYPVAFGITFTPLVSGITFAIIGLLGSAYIFVSFGLPVLQNYQTLVTNKIEKQAKIQGEEELEEQLRKLESEVRKAQSIKPKILEEMWAGENNLDTLLIDLNGFIEGRKAQLLTFNPVGREEVVRDGSLGKGVNGKLKRQEYNLQMQGTFEQTKSIMRNIERLQSLLVVKDFNSKVTERPTLLLDGEKVVSQGETLLTTNFTVEALIPLGESKVAKEE